MQDPNPSAAMLKVFNAALRRLDDEQLNVLRARFIERGEISPGVPAIDREMRKRSRRQVAKVQQR